jgi:hypothetical protein
VRHCRIDFYNTKFQHLKASGSWSKRCMLMSAKDVKTHVKRNKNESADAEAICEAVRRQDHGPRSFPGSGAAIEIDTHWLGGRRHFEQRWEIADIGVVVALRRRGKLLWRKVALLQSKRLYSREIPVSEMERSDYAICIGRLVDQAETLQPLTQPRRFRFSPECVYGAMRSGDEQSSVIDRYMRDRRMPVYYSFYNPPNIP